MKLRITRHWRWLVALGGMLIPGIVAGAFDVPHSFKPGTAIKAAEMNENFAAIAAKLDGIGKKPAAVQVGTLAVKGGTPLPIYGFSQTVQTPFLVGGGGAAKPKFSDVVVRHAVTDDSIALIERATMGKLADVTIALGNLEIVLSNTRVTSVAASGTGPGIPQESVSFSFSAIKWTWQEANQPAHLLEWDLVKASGGGGQVTNFNFGFFPPGATPDPAYTPIRAYDHAFNTPAGTKPAHDPVSIKKAVDVVTLSELGAGLSPKGGNTLKLDWYSDETTVNNSLELDGVAVTEVALTTGDDGTLNESASFVYSKILWSTPKSQATWDVVKGTP